MSEGLTPSEAREILKQERGIDARVIGNPIAPRVGPLRGQLKEATQRDLLLDEVLDRLKGSPLRGLVELRTIDPTKGNTEMRYFVSGKYIDQNPDRLTAPGNVGFEVVDTVLGAVRTRSFQGKRSTVNEPRETVKILIDQVTERRVEFLRDWERQFVALIGNVTKRDQLDGLIKEFIIASLIDDAISGSADFKEATRLTRRELDLRENAYEQWFKPRAPDATMKSDVRSITEDELMGLYRTSKTRWSSLKEIADKKIQWIGFLARSEGGAMECVMRSAPPSAEGNLFIAVGAKDSSKTEMVPIGRYADDRADLKPSRLNLIPGRPVFYLPD